MTEADLPPVLTLWRPWAELILRHGKDVENRDWQTGYRGPLLVHAGQIWDDEAFWSCMGRIPVHSAGPWADEDNPTGIVGVVDLIDVCTAMAIQSGVKCSCSPWAMTLSVHWRLANRRPFAAPIPCRGHQKLWRVPPDVAPAVERALAGVAP